MKNSKNNFLIPDYQKADPEVTTTIMVDEVPSEVAYDILFESLKKGEVLTKEELKSRINLHESRINMTFDEMIEYIINRVNDYSNNLVEPEFYFEQHRETAAHNIGDWMTNPENPEEEIRVCTDCGYVMDKRTVHTTLQSSDIRDEYVKMEEDLDNHNMTNGAKAVEHKPSKWMINPDNPEEEIIICLDCGCIMDKRDIQHSYDEEEDYQNGAMNDIEERPIVRR